MSTTTTRGIAYPTSGDSIAPLESHFSGMASSIETILAKNVSGKTSTFTIATTLGTAATQTVTFPVAFASGSVPNVTATVSTTTAGSVYVANIYSITNTGFSVKVTRVYGTTNDGNLSVHWNAKVE